MAAALRNLAARLGGRAALQAANVPGRLPARLVRTKPITEDEELKDAAFRHLNILAMKEELFDEIAQFRKKYYISAMNSWNEEMLLYPLSLGIKPRPGDTFRRSCRRQEILNRFFWLVGLLTSINMAGNVFGWCVRKALKPEGNEKLENEKKMASAGAV